MSKRGKRIVVIVLIVLSVLAAVLIGLWAYTRAPLKEIAQLDLRYNQVQRGMDAAEVEKTMNYKGNWRESNFKAWWDDELLGDVEDRRIKRAVRLTVETFFLPVSFEFTFDADGKVVGRHRYD